MANNAPPPNAPPPPIRFGGANGFYAQYNNPYGNNPGLQRTSWEPDAANVPATLFASCSSTEHPKPSWGITLGPPSF